MTKNCYASYSSNFIPVVAPKPRAKKVRLQKAFSTRRLVAVSPEARKALDGKLCHSAQHKEEKSKHHISIGCQAMHTEIAEWDEDLVVFDENLGQNDDQL